MDRAFLATPSRGGAAFQRLPLCVHRSSDHPGKGSSSSNHERSVYHYLAVTMHEKNLEKLQKDVLAEPDAEPAAEPDAAKRDADTHSARNPFARPRTSIVKRIESGTVSRITIVGNKIFHDFTLRRFFVSWLE